MLIETLTPTIHYLHFCHDANAFQITSKIIPIDIRKKALLKINPIPIDFGHFTSELFNVVQLIIMYIFLIT